MRLLSGKGIDRSGNVLVSTPSQVSSDSPTGSISLLTGKSSSDSSGAIVVSTGNAGEAGDISIQPGHSSKGQGGAVVLNAGEARNDGADAAPNGPDAAGSGDWEGCEVLEIRLSRSLGDLLRKLSRREAGNSPEKQVRQPRLVV